MGGSSEGREVQIIKDENMMQWQTTRKRGRAGAGEDH